MAVSVISSGSQACTVGTEHQLALITVAGSYQLVLDVSALASGTTPDILRVRVYGRARSGDTEVLEDDFQIVGAQARALYRTLPTWSPHHYRVTITQTQGTGRTIPWAVYGIQ